MEKFCCLIIWPLSFVMPVKKAPEIALLLNIFLIYQMTEFILTVFNVFSVYSHLSHLLVGLTMMVWGSDTLELANMSIALKKKRPELVMASILSCQVLCLILIVPMACLARMNSRSQNEIQILQPIHSNKLVVLPVLLLSFLTAVVLYWKKMALDRKSALILLAIYVSYFLLAIFCYKNESD